LNPYRITIETDNPNGTGLTELFIDESRSLILVHPKIDIDRTLDDPEVGHDWKVLKWRMREFAEYVLANGHDNSAGDFLEQFAREASTGSESFHIEAYIGSAGNEEAVDLYIDGDAAVSLMISDRGVGQPGSDTVAFFGDGGGLELIGRWEELKVRIKGFAGSLAAMQPHGKIAQTWS
jgi:hypothetical protein